jgi:hypothetical protein
MEPSNLVLESTSEKSSAIPNRVVFISPKSLSVNSSSI